MDVRRSVISGVMFGGVLLAGAVVARPGLFSPLGPGKVATATGSVLHLGEHEGDDDDRFEDDEHEDHEHEDDEYDHDDD